MNHGSAGFLLLHKEIEAMSRLHYGEISSFLWVECFNHEFNVHFVLVGGRVWWLSAESVSLISLM